MKLEPLTWVAMLIQVGSPSSVGSVPVTQSTILRSPVQVVVRLGWSSETPVSTMPIVTPRPSHVGCASEELRRAGVADRHVGVARGASTRREAVFATLEPTGLGPRIRQRDDLVEVRGVDPGEADRLRDLVQRDGRADVAELIVAIADLGPEPFEPVDHGLGLTRLRRDQQDDRVLPLCARLGDGGAFSFDSLPPGAAVGAVAAARSSSTAPAAVSTASGRKTFFTLSPFEIDLDTASL